MSSLSFNTAFETAYNDRQIEGSKRSRTEYNPAWKNGTDYFDGLVPDRSIECVCVSTDPKGRRLVIIPTPEGNVVFFDRSSSRNGVIICQAPLSAGDRQLVDAFHVTPTEVEALGDTHRRRDWINLLYQLNQ